jgi:hypothetical protein
MYAYFGGAGFLKHSLPWTGIVQLAVGIFVDLFMGWRKYMESGGSYLWPHIFSGGLLGVYFVLQVRDLRARRA